MRLLCCLLLLFALSALRQAQEWPPADPRLTARWTVPGQAVVSWTQPPGIRLTCAYRERVLLCCWQGLRAGRMALSLGGSGTDFRDRPAAGDEYRLWMDGVETRATIRGEVRLPIVRR